MSTEDPIRHVLAKELCHHANQPVQPCAGCIERATAQAAALRKYFASEEVRGRVGRYFYATCMTLPGEGQTRKVYGTLTALHLTEEKQ